MNLRNRSRLQLALLWSLSLLLFPLLLAQGIRVRRIALRLPEAEPPDTGRFGSATAENPFRIVGIGDSVIAGVGVKRLEESLTAAVARGWQAKTGEPASWHALGVNGECLRELLTRLEANPLPAADLVVVSIGVNDVTRLTGLLKWQLQVTELVTRLQGNRIVLLGVPPMEYFTALPSPLRWVLGIRAALLDLTLQQIGQLLPDVTWVNAAMKFDAEHLAEDGYHPNALACVEIAAEIVDAVLPEQALDKQTAL